MRIVSLLPAATEIVWALGLADDLVGVSHACDFPAGVVGRPVVTSPGVPPDRRRAEHVAADDRVGRPDERGARLAVAGAPSGPNASPVAIDHALLAGLHPDLVIAPPGRGMGRSGIDPTSALRETIGDEATLLTLEPTSLEGAFHAIATIGAMTEAEDEAVGLVEILRERLADVEEVVEERRGEGHRAPRVVVLGWLDPPSAAGFWVPEQVRRAGGWELVGAGGLPGVSTTWESIVDLDPEMLILAPYGSHLADSVRAWHAAPKPPVLAEVEAVRRGQVFALDAAAYFSRPGPRLVEGIELLAEIFDPASFVDLAPATSWVPVP